MELAIIIAVVVVALVFDYTNGFHDATSVARIVHHWWQFRKNSVQTMSSA